MTKINQEQEFNFTDESPLNKKFPQMEDKSQKHKDQLLIGKIDHFYSSIRNPSSYYSRIRIIALLTLTCHFTSAFYLLNITSKPKNNTYCFDQFSKEFSICDFDSRCYLDKQGITNYIYVPDNYSDIDPTIEVNNINIYYKEFFLHQYLLFSKNNYNKINKFQETLLYFNNIALVTKNENNNLFFTFKQVCHRGQILSELLFFLFIGVLFGVLIFCFAADVFGRRKIIILSTFICGISSIGLGLFSLILVNNINSNAKNLNFNGTGELDHLSFLSYKFNDKNSTELIKNMTINNLISDSFNNNKLYFYFLSSLIYGNIWAGIITILVFLLENSLNDSNIFYNYNFAWYASPLCLIILWISNFILNEISKFMFFLGGIYIICYILQIKFFYESPRHLFEFYEYDEITSFFVNFQKCNEIDKFKIDKLDPMIKSEVMNNIKSKSESSFCTILKLIINKNKSKLYIFNAIFRSDIMKNPIIIFKLMMKNKKLKKNFLILTSLVINISLIYNLTFCNTQRSYFYSRKDLLSQNNYVIPIISSLIVVISQFFFNFLLKFFGVNYILFLCFGFILIFSVVFQIKESVTINLENLNIYTLNSPILNYEDNRYYFLSCIWIIFFFSNGLYYILLFYLTKYTKTIYRCLLIGIFYLIFIFCTVLSQLINFYFDKSMYIITISSIMGFVNSYFQDNEFDSIISEYRKIILNDNKN